MCGGGGRDQLFGSDGRDRLFGNAGADSLDGGNGADRLSGGGGADSLTGDAQARRAAAVQASDDVIAGGPGLDIVVLWKHPKAKGNIKVDLGAGTARGQGNDTLRAIEGAYVDSVHADVLVGSAGPNSFFSGDGADLEQGLGGDDRFFAGDGDDRHEGGAGSDTIDMSMTYQAVVSLVSGTARSSNTGTDTLLAIENATGSEGDDVLTGDLSANVLEGLGGQDVLRGLAGDDVLRGGDNDSVPDRVDSLAGGLGNDLLDGGRPGIRDDYRDEVDYTSSDVAVVVDLAAGTATGEGNDTLLRVEDVIGSAGNDVISGDDGPNELNGSVGDDLVDGRAGDDELEGSPGNDRFVGGDGIDEAQFNYSPVAVTVDLAAGTATGQGSDTITQVENVRGTIHDDVLAGDGGPNQLIGGLGDDTLGGGPGDDFLRAERGDDTVNADSGNDIVWPGEGNDTVGRGDGDDLLAGSPDDDALDGGAGSDTVDYATASEPIEVDLVAGTATGPADRHRDHDGERRGHPLRRRHLRQCGAQPPGRRRGAGPARRPGGRRHPARRRTCGRPRRRRRHRHGRLHRRDPAGAGRPARRVRRGHGTGHRRPDGERRGLGVPRRPSRRRRRQRAARRRQRRPAQRP